MPRQYWSARGVRALAARCRLVCSLMMHGRNSGKKTMAVRIVKHAFDIVKLTSDSNPIQILVDAIINGGPREDATRIGSAGVVRRQAVDVSPMRRVNQAVYLLTTGAREASFRNIKTIAECLADELINAAKGSSNRCAQLSLLRPRDLNASALMPRMHAGIVTPRRGLTGAACVQLRDQEEGRDRARCQG